MKLVRRLGLAAVLAFAATSVVACGGSVETPQTSASAATKAPIAQSSHGMVKVMGDALGEVPLRAEQRTELEKLAAEAEQRHASLADGRKELVSTIADQIEKGAIDRAALQPKLDRIAADFEKVRPADQAALARVHQILDSEQRSAFVDALEKRMHEARGAHRHEGKGGFGHMKQLADELKLTEQQRDQIKDVLKDAHGHGGEKGEHHAWKGRHVGGDEMRGGPHGPKGMLESFRSEKFDPSQAGPPAGAKELAAKGTSRMLDLAEKILPILTPEQRKIAADKIRAMSASGETPFGH